MFIGEDRKKSRDEGMPGVFANGMMPTGVCRTNRNASIAQDGVRTRGGDFYGFIAPVNLVTEIGHHPKLDLLIVSWYFQQRPPAKLYIVNL